MITTKSGEFIFYYGSMGSGKTSMLLRKHYNLTCDNDIPVLLLKPSKDDRYGEDIIQSRDGLFATAISIGEEISIIELVENSKIKPHIIMLDEIQFFSRKQIDQLKDLTDNYNIVVEAYGLKINFRGNLFGEESGSIKRLLELCTSEKYIKSSCSCGNDASHIARYNPETWEIQTEGPRNINSGK